MRALWREFAALGRLWIVLLFSYALLKFIFNLGVRSFIDLSGWGLQDVAVVPSLQAAVLWAILRGRRACNGRP